MKENGLKNAILNLNQLFYRRYVDDIVSSKSTNPFEKVCNYFKTCHQNMTFSLKKERKVKCPF